MQTTPHPAQWWTQEKHGIRCSLCPRNCLITEEKPGFCRVRQAKKNALYSLVYANPWSVAVDPIEKKPLYHFFPGSRALSIGTAGCNMSCTFCQNHSLVYSPVEQGGMYSLPPKEVYQLAINEQCASVAFTYNEPTVFAEYVLDSARLCRENGIKTVMVTNGYIGKQARDDVYAHIDAANVDLKFFSEKLYRKYTAASLKAILETIEALLAKNVWVEITTLLIPDVNDDHASLQEQFRYLYNIFGNEVVIHLSAFHPSYKLNKLARTPPAILQQARKIARAEGLHYVYLGNVLDPESTHTTCHKCGANIIDRSKSSSQPSLSQANSCVCGALIPGRFT